MGLLDDVWGWMEEHPGLTVFGGVSAAFLLGGGGAVVAEAVQTGQPIGTALSNAINDVIAPTPRIPAGSTMHTSSLPVNYAHDNANATTTRWNGALGDAERRMTPIVWPGGVPPEVFSGFASNGSQTANTALSRPYGVENPFAEMGYFGTEGGPRSTPPNAGPYPNPTNPRDNSWLTLHADPLVIAALGHPATMVPDAWKTDVDAQTAVGLVNLRKRLDSVNRGAPAGTAATNPAGVWAITLAFMGWSAGTGGTQSHLRRYAAQIAPAPEDHKLQAFVAAIVADQRANRSTGASGSHSNPAYSLMRTLQKIESGKLLATTNGGANAAWFPTVASADQVSIVRAAYNERA